MTDVIEIPLSKKKAVLLLIGAVTFVLLGLLFTLNPESFISSRYRNSEIIKIAGIASVLFFGLCSVFITKKLFDTKIGLRIDQKGIFDNSNARVLGLSIGKTLRKSRLYRLPQQNFL